MAFFMYGLVIHMHSIFVTAANNPRELYLALNNKGMLS